MLEAKYTQVSKIKVLMVQKHFNYYLFSLYTVVYNRGGKIKK